MTDIFGSIKIKNFCMKKKKPPHKQNAKIKGKIYTTYNKDCYPSFIKNSYKSIRK